MTLHMHMFAALMGETAAAGSASEEASDEEHPLDDDDLEPGDQDAGLKAEADSEEADDFEAQLRWDCLSSVEQGG